MINPTYQKHLPKVLLLLAFAGKATATADEIVDEPTRLTILLRELNTIERLAAAGDLANSPTSSRYHFNYGRLRADIARVSMGIQSYLSPQRATPREVVVLHGSYIDETAPDQ